MSTRSPSTLLKAPQKELRDAPPVKYLALSVLSMPHFRVQDRQQLYSQDSAGRRSVSYTITRTKYFDDAILLAVGTPNHNVSAMFDDVRVIVGNAESTCQQVVMLGSGFDSRPWRLSLGATRWFEVDLKEVITEKQRLLKTANASVALEVEKVDILKAGQTFVV